MWPIPIETSSFASAGTILWRHVGRLNLTVVVKVKVSLDEGMARVGPADEIVMEERFPAGARAISHDSDVAPYKPRAEVTLIGSACARAPVPQLDVKLGVHGDGAFFEKQLRVFGDRSAPGGPPTPFQRMPITWERAWGDGMANPAGIEPDGRRMPNVVDPEAMTAPAGYGPIGCAWAARARFMGHADPRQLRGTQLEMPNDLSWGYFLAAPPDQQLKMLRGNEVIVLESLIEGRPRVRSQLPALHATASLIGPGAGPNGAAIALKIDTLAIDADRQHAHVLFRGTASIANESAARQFRVVSTVEARAAIDPVTTAPPPPRPTFGFSPPTPEPKTMPVGKHFELPKLHEDNAPQFDLDEPDSTAGSTMAIDPEVAMKMIAARAPALPFGHPGAPKGPPPAPPPPAPPQSPLASTAVTMPVAPSPPARPAPGPPMPAPPPPPPAMVMPAPPQTPGAPNVVVRGTNAFAATDEESGGSTMAMTPEAAAQLLARKGNSPPQPGLPPAPPPMPHPPGRVGAKTLPPNVPMPAPPPPMPPMPGHGRHGTMEMGRVPDDDEDEGGGTMVLEAPQNPPQKPRR